MTPPYKIDAPLTDAAREVMRPPSDLSVSEWVDRYRILPARGEAYPGPWRNWRTPYLVEPMDSWTDPDCNRIVFVASTQVGKSAFLLNILSRTADEDPGPMLWVLPVKDSAARFCKRKIKPALESSPRIRRLLSGRKTDWTVLELAVGGMDIRLAGANSAAGLAADAMRYLILDEVDKFAARAGKEGPPILLARERLRTYEDAGDAMEAMASTPTFVEGPIWQAWLESDRRRYFVPCPHCGEYQALEFNRERVKWPEDERNPDKVASDRLAWYVCAHCEERIDDDDDTHETMLIAGVWVQEGATITSDGVVHGERTDNRTRGYHLNALYSPFLNLSKIAAKFMECKTEGALQNFYNSWLGLPWQRRRKETTVDHVRGLASSHAAREVPDFVVVLTAGADVGADWIHYTIRGWGVGERSAQIESGRCQTFDELEALLFFRSFERIGEHAGELVPLRLVCIDYQYRKAEVLALCDKHPYVARPIRGRQHQSTPWTGVKRKRDDHGAASASAARLFSIDTSYYKDKVHAFQHTKTRGAPGTWLLHRDPLDQYLQEITAEHRVLYTDSKGVAREEWLKKGTATANHWWDCEVYAAAAADMIQVFALTDETPKDSAYVQSLRDTAPPPTKPPARRIRGDGEGRIRRPGR